ncbi:MAG: hypothetical protein J5927_07360 [Oscillospiraceae bacterium]|nr:hypothetical protein [Oscillospiraceae bacterium]
MALDQAYFDAIHIDVVKKKYYNANKVEAVFADIRRQAEALEAENQALRQQLETVGDPRLEMGETLLSAQSLYREILERANQKAEAMLRETESRCAAMEAEAQRRQDYAVQRAEGCFNRLKQLHEEAVETINAEWQGFLCGLYPETEDTAAPPAADPAPADLEQKVGAIAQELFAIGEEAE